MAFEEKIKKKMPKIEEMTKEQIRKTIIRKRETSVRAQQIVESLLEPGLGEDVFLSYLPHINQNHLEDVIEERAIASVCGYPLCPNLLVKDKIPRQRYRIDVKTNRVYDITARKNFCCNKCYEAASYIKKQMLTSPLWFREYEQIPNFQLMPADTIANMGQEIDLSITEKIKLSTKLTSMNDFAMASLNDMDNSSSEKKVDQSQCSNIIPNELNITKKYKKQDSATNTNSDNYSGSLINDKSFQESQVVGFSIAECNNNIHGINNTNVPNVLNKIKSETVITECIGNSNVSHNTKGTGKQPKPSLKNNNSINIIGNIIERPEKTIDPILTSVKHDTKMCVKSTSKIRNSDINIHEVAIVNVIIHVEKCISEWFTLDSMIFLFGEQKVKEMIVDKGECIKKFHDNVANSLFYSASSYDQYQLLCRKLNMLDLEDLKYDKKVTSKETKPLPDYTMLKEESKKIELKVKAFLAGECKIEETDVKVDDKEDDSSNKTQLPLVDKNAQNALRRKILLTSLNKVLYDLQRSLGLQNIDLSTEIRLLVNGFKLKANNIMFKPIQWTLIGIVMIKLLSLRDVRIQQAFQTTKADHHLQLLMLSYKQDIGYLDRLLLWLTDVDRLLDTSQRQLTMG